MLGQARESAIELRAKAEEHARRVVREAQETARELRATTQQAVETKTREAEDAARTRAKEIVGEARGLRERVLGDLNERRQELERQIVDLRAGRGKLVETYELVERALGHAARVMAEEPSAPPDVPAVDGARRPTSRRPEPTPPASEAPAPVAPPAPGRRRWRPNRSHRSRRSTNRRPARATTVSPRPTSVPCSRSCGPKRSTTAPACRPRRRRRPRPTCPRRRSRPPGRRRPPRRTTPDAPEEPDEHDVEIAEAATTARDAALAETTEDLSRRGKRALQDEQNDLLDGLRRQRGKIDTGKVLPALEDQLARWAHVLQPAVDAAYAAGAGSVPAASGGGSVGAAPRALLTELATAVVVPLRERLVELARVDRRPHPGRRRDRHRAAARRALPRVPGRAARGRARRRAGGGLGPRRLRRRARRGPAAVGPGRGRAVPRLRRQRARADGAGQRLPDRAAAPAGAPGLSLLPRGRDPPERRRRTALPRSRPPLPSRLRPDARPSGRAPRRRFRIRGWIIAVVVVLVVLFFSLRGLAGFYTDYLWFDSVGFGEHVAQPALGPVRARAGLHGPLLRDDAREPDRRRPARAQYRSMGPEDELLARYQQVVGPVHGRIRIAVVAVLRAGRRRRACRRSGSSGSSSRTTQSFGIKDPQFHKDVGFYVFRLPFLTFLVRLALRRR